MNYNNTYNYYMNPDSLKEIRKLKEKIEEEINKDNPNPEEIYKLRLSQRLKGLGMNGLSARNNRTIYPY